MITEEMLSKLKALGEKEAELLKEYADASEREMEALERRLEEIGHERSRVMGFSEAEIAEIDAEAEAEMKVEIEREVEIGLELFQGALRGDQTAIEKLASGSLEFATAIGEGAISRKILKNCRSPPHS